MKTLYKFSNYYSKDCTDCNLPDFDTRQLQMLTPMMKKHHVPTFCHSVRTKNSTMWRRNCHV